MSLMFRGENDLLNYLVNTKHGKGVMREAISISQEITEWTLAVNKTTYTLVKAYRDGLVEVYGPKHSRAKIAFLGRSSTFPEHEVQLEQHLDSILPQPYREIHYPNNLRASGMRDSGLERDRTIRAGATEREQWLDRTMQWRIDQLVAGEPRSCTRSAASKGS
jgi:hypothetical protein